MGALDWTIVLVLNGTIIAYGFYLSRHVTSSADWFLAGRILPWWLVGISMYATAIDSSDLVADSGATYSLGIRYCVTNWVGVVGGWAIAAFFVCLPMHRAGMYTNAEYLEARYGPSVRVICALIQVQYRTLVLGIISMTMFLTFSIICGLSPSTSWSIVLAIAALATIYTAFGGLRSVAVTDALQFIVMTIAAIVIWCFVWNLVGGWEGIEQRLAEHDASLAKELLHVGHDYIERETIGDHVTGIRDQQHEEQIRRKLIVGGEFDADTGTIIRRTPAWLVSVALIIMGFAYSIVNHTQSMRMLASRTEWHLKMSVFAAGVAMIIMSFFNLSMGFMGRALFPVESDLPMQRLDAIYPHLVSQFDTVGLKGIVVAGILAAGLSTYDSIGSSLSALLTRDVYARLIVTDRDDRHYLRIGQCLTPLVIGISFLYIPFLEGGMLLFYLELTSCFVVPLLTLYLLGVFTPVHRQSGLLGLIFGATYGVIRLMAAPLAENYGITIMPAWMTNTYAAYPASMVITAGTMAIASLWLGWHRGEKLLHQEQGTWLHTSQLAVRQPNDAVQITTNGILERWIPMIATLFVILLGCILSFVVFW